MVMAAGENSFKGNSTECTELFSMGVVLHGNGMTGIEDLLHMEG